MNLFMNLGKSFGIAIVFVLISISGFHGINLLDHDSTLQQSCIKQWPTDDEITLYGDVANTDLSFDYGKFKIEKGETVVIALTDLHNTQKNYGQIVGKLQLINSKCPHNKKIVVVNGDFIDANYGKGLDQDQKDKYFSDQIIPLLSLLLALTANENTEVVWNMGNHELHSGAIRILPYILQLVKYHKIPVHLINCNFCWEKQKPILARSVKPYVQIGNVIIAGYCPPALYGRPSEDDNSVKRLKQTLSDIFSKKGSIILAAHMGARKAEDLAYSLPLHRNFRVTLCGHSHKPASHSRSGDRSHLFLTPPSHGKGMGVMVIRANGKSRKMRFW